MMKIRGDEHMTAAQYREMHGLSIPTKLGPLATWATHLPLAGKDPRVPHGILARMNKTEQAYDRHLRCLKLEGVGIRTWYFEPAIWRLPASKGKVNTFRPDFLVIYADDSEEWVEIKRAWKVKGSRFEYRPGFQADARVKLVTFAGTYPELRVVLRWFHPYHSVWEEEVFNG